MKIRFREIARGVVSDEDYTNAVRFNSQAGIVGEEEGK